MLYWKSLVQQLHYAEVVFRVAVQLECFSFLEFIYFPLGGGVIHVLLLAPFDEAATWCALPLVVGGHA